MIDAEGYQVLCANCDLKKEIEMRGYSVAEAQ